MNAHRFRVEHRTTYEYSQAMSDGYTIAYVVPRETPHQSVESVDVHVDPEPDERAERRDLFGNRLLQLGIHHEHKALTVAASSDVVLRPMELATEGPPWESVATTIRDLRGAEALDVRPFVGGVPLVTDPGDVDDLRELTEPAFEPGRPMLDAARALCRDIYETFDYDRSFTEVSTPLSTVLDARRGVCQDFAHLAVSALRLFGLAARYVSGYLETSPKDGEERLVGADASHAWCSVWVPDVGEGLGGAQGAPGLGGAQGAWVDFDPTNNRLPTDRHITVAWGRDYGDVAPVRGVVIGPPATQTLSVAVQVTRPLNGSSVAGV